MTRIRKLFQTVNHMKIKNKFMIVFFVVVFIPLLFVGVFLTTRMKSMALKQSFHEAENEVTRVTSQLEEFIDFNVTLQNSLLSDGKLFEIVNHEFSTSLEIFEYYNEYKVLENYERTYQGIEDIRVYAENDTLLDNMDFMRVTDEIGQSYWYRQSILWEGKVIAMFQEDRIRNKSYLMLTKGYKMSNNKHVVIMTLLDLNHIFTFIRNERFDIQILDAKSNILASTSEEDMRKNLYDVAGMYLVPKDSETYRDIYKGKKSQLFLTEMEKSYMVLPLYVLSAVPLNQILAEANQVSTLGFTVIFISMFLATFLIIWFSDLLTKRIGYLVKDMKRVGRGEFDNIKVYEAEDEIGVMSKNLDAMAKNLAKLIEENNQSKEKEKELLVATEKMKFEVLSSQVNPHFLFNILESLRMRAHIHGENEVAAGIKRLGKLMRRSLQMTGDMVTVKDELEFVEHYIELQRFRFSDKMDYRIEMEEETGSMKILPLLIQPIVENAIVHGLEALKSDGFVSIRVFFSQDKLHIEVEDNGKGIDPEELKWIKRRLNSVDLQFSRDHIGVMNVCGRLKNYYGEGSRFIIKPLDTNGTIVKMEIPREVQEK